MQQICKKTGTNNEIMNMEKKVNKYKLTLEQISVRKEDVILSEPITLEFENHDEIFKIVEFMREKDLFGNENQSVEFAVGLKMFSEVMIKNKTNPLFKELLPAFIEFMKKLKS